MATTNTLLGRGPTYPFQRVGSDFQQAEGLDLVEASLLQIIRAQKGEIPWFQEFGTNLEMIRHRPMDETLLAEAEDDVRTALAQFEPRAEVREIEIRKLTKPTQGFYIKVAWAPLARPGAQNAVLAESHVTEVEI